MTPTTDLGLFIRLSMFELRETGDWDIFQGPPERARAETGGADQWVLKRRELPGFARVNKVTSASLGYPLSVFNKNSTLKQKHIIYILSLIWWLSWEFDTHERQKDRSLVIITIPNPQSTINIQVHHFKTPIMCPRSIAGVPSSQAASRLPCYCTPPVCVPDVTRGLSVLRQNKTQQVWRFRASLLLHTTCVSACCTWCASCVVAKH